MPSHHLYSNHLHLLFSSKIANTTLRRWSSRVTPVTALARCLKSAKERELQLTVDTIYSTYVEWGCAKVHMSTHRHESMHNTHTHMHTHTKVHHCTTYNTTVHIVNVIVNRQALDLFKSNPTLQQKRGQSHGHHFNTGYHITVQNTAKGKHQERHLHNLTLGWHNNQQC